MSNKEVVKLTVEGLKQDKANGLTNPQMATKYGLSPGQISKAMKMAGIKLRPVQKKFEIEGLMNDLRPEVAEVNHVNNYEKV